MSRSLFLFHFLILSYCLFLSHSVSLSLDLSCSLPSSLSQKTKDSGQDYQPNKPWLQGASQQDSHFMVHQFTLSCQVLAHNPNPNPNSKKRGREADPEESQNLSPPNSKKRGREADPEESQNLSPPKKARNYEPRVAKMNNNQFALLYANYSGAKTGHHDNKVEPMPPPSSTDYQNSNSRKGGKILIGSRLFELKTTKEVLERLQSEVKPMLVERLKQLSEAKAEYEIELAMADYAFLLKMLSLPNPKFQTVAKNAGKGSLLLQKGVRLMNEGRELLRSAVTDTEAQSA